jgi:hypothetical protein
MAEDLLKYQSLINAELNQLRQTLLSTLVVPQSTGALKGSARINVKDLSATSSAVMDLVFFKYGVVIHAKRPFVVKAPAEDIADWIRRIGLSKFRTIPGVQKGRVPSEDKQIIRLVWAIKRHGKLAKVGGADAYMTSKTATRVTNAWFFRPFFSELRSMQERLAPKIGDALSRDIYGAVRRQISGS